MNVGERLRLVLLAAGAVALVVAVAGVSLAWDFVAGNPVRSTVTPRVASDASATSAGSGSFFAPILTTLIPQETVTASPTDPASPIPEPSPSPGVPALAPAPTAVPGPTTTTTTLQPPRTTTTTTRTSAPPTTTTTAPPTSPSSTTSTWTPPGQKKKRP